MDDQYPERELREGLAELLDPTMGSHPRWAASPAAARVAGLPAHRRLSGQRALLWAAALLGLLLAALVAATVLVGSQPDQADVNGPSDILATTTAHVLPAQATCPPGGDPDTPGLADQARPASEGAWSMAFDRHAGRIVALAGTEAGPDRSVSRTWTYDVCTNTWQRMDPLEEPVAGWGSPSPARLVYDADSDRTLAFGDGMRIWGYELAADRWTEVGSLPWAEDATTYGTIFYHDPSGLVVAYDGATMWAYDVDTNTLSEVRQRADPARPEGSGMPQGKVALEYDPIHDLVIAVVVPYEGVPDDPTGQGPDPLPGRYRAPLSKAGHAWTTGETWTFGPDTGQWRLETAEASIDLIVCGVWFKSEDCYPTYGRSAYDAASGLTVFMVSDFRTRFATSGVSGISIVDAYDADTGTWQTLFPTQGAAPRAAGWCERMPPVYDPLHERIVCQGSGNGVSAFSTSSGEWRWLIEPALATVQAPDTSATGEP